MKFYKKAINLFFRPAIFICNHVFVLALFSCSNIFAQKSITTLTRPTVIFLSSKPKPVAIPLPSRQGDAYKIQTQTGVDELKLAPPKVNPLPLSRNLSNKGLSDSLIFPEAQGHSFFTIYTSDNGLTMDAILSSIIDKSGNLWLGTSVGGVSKFDGKTFTNYTTEQGLADNTVWAIKEDKAGNIWFGTNGGGISCFDGKSFKNFSKKQGLANDIVLCIEEDRKGNLWFGTNGGGVSQFDGKKFTNYTSSQGLTHNLVLSIEEDKNGIMWFGTGGAGVARFDGKTFTAINKSHGLSGNFILSILEDAHGNLWFGTDGRGISRYDGKVFTNYSTAHGLPSKTIRCIVEDKVGNLWFGTDGGGVSCFDGIAFTNFTTAQGLPNNAVFSIVEDRTGNLWFNTYGGGTACYRGRSFVNFTTADGLVNNQVMSIAEDKSGNMWFGTYGGGTARYNGKSFTHFGSSQGFLDFVLSVAADSSGAVWVGSFLAGLSHFDGKESTVFSMAQGLVGRTIYCILPDSKGNVWFTTSDGISCFNGSSFKNYTTQNGLLNNTIVYITEDKKGRLWMAVEDEGVSCYTPGPDGEGTLINFRVSEGLPNNSVLHISEDKFGNIWLATEGGLCRYDGTSFLTFNSKNGLLRDAVNQVITDKNGVLWLGSSTGICSFYFKPPSNGTDEEVNNSAQIPAGMLKISNKDLSKYTPVFEFFNTNTGYPVKDINGGANVMMEDSKGIVWIGTSSDKTGLVRFDPSALKKSPLKPALFIKSVKIGDEKLSWSALMNKRNNRDSSVIKNEEVGTFGRVLKDWERNQMSERYSDIEFDSIGRWNPIPQNLVLPYRHNSITVDFSAVELIRNFQVRYQYILEGNDKDWSTITDKTSVTFGNLHEGNYIFKVKAQSSFGVWSEPVSYTFKVLPPWWRTWWMYMLYIVTLVGSVIFIVRWNHRRLISQKNKLKTKIVRATNTIREEKEKIQKANELITLQRKETEEQKKIVEEKNKDILDSIHYAKRIQDAMLIKREYFKDHIPEYMLLFLPKDIVSGDFYWAHSKFSNPQQASKENMYWYLAAADCTGHGVPGAVMSMLGMSFLNEIIKDERFLTPAEILDKLREKVIKELGQTGERENSKDGMDISFIRWDFATNEFLWAGANNPIYLIRNGELQKIKGDKQPIGYFPDPKPFTNQSFKLEKGDCFYIFSDGYADQFGGPLGKKFKYKQLEDLLLKNYQLSMKEQRKILRDTFKNWKGDQEQVDDVCIVGIRVD